MYKNNSKPSWEQLQEREDVFFFKENTFVKSYNDTMRYVVNKTDLQAGMMYYLLLSHYNVNKKECFPSLETLSTESGVSTNTVTAIIKRLEKAEVIKKIKGKQGKCNQYSFPLEEKRLNQNSNRGSYNYPRNNTYSFNPFGKNDEDDEW